jgi:hypothetical protein
VNFSYLQVIDENYNIIARFDHLDCLKYCYENNYLGMRGLVIELQYIQILNV